MPRSDRNIRRPSGLLNPTSAETISRALSIVRLLSSGWYGARDVADDQGMAQSAGYRWIKILIDAGVPVSVERRTGTAGRPEMMYTLSRVVMRRHLGLTDHNDRRAKPERMALVRDMLRRLAPQKEIVAATGLSQRRVAQMEARLRRDDPTLPTRRRSRQQVTGGKR